MRLPAMRFTFLVATALSLDARQAPELRIIVIEGEGGVNIIQQKTAVGPLVEVRDRNNLPVPGAAVTFTIGGPNAAFAGGVQTLTVTTNAAGQAAASSLNAIRGGAFQIQVQAVYQGQIATAAISQTNVATAAAAAQAGAGVGSGGGGASSGASAGAAGGGGGGLSAVTIGIIGAAVGGGALAATQVVGRDNARRDNAGGGRPEPLAVYQGPISGQLVFTNFATNPQGLQTACVSTRSLTGSLKITMRVDNIGGTANVETTQTELSVTGAQGCIPSTQPITVSVPSADVSGGPSALTFTNTSSGPLVSKVGFGGSLSGATITGTLTIEMSSSTGNGSTTVPVTLQK